MTKVLANKLKGQWKGSLVSKRENAPTITGKFWTSELNVDECLDSRMRSSCSWVICKLDKKNTYDHINWDYFIYTLGTFGLENKWQEFIFVVFSMVKFPILVISNPAGNTTSNYPWKRIWFMKIPQKGVPKECLRIYDLENIKFVIAPSICTTKVNYKLEKRCVRSNNRTII